MKDFSLRVTHSNAELRLLWLCSANVGFPTLVVSLGMLLSFGSSQIRLERAIALTHQYPMNFFWIL
jgi:hypothetical protein